MTAQPEPDQTPAVGEVLTAETARLLVKGDWISSNQWGAMQFDHFDDSLRRAFQRGLDGQVRLLVCAGCTFIGRPDSEGWIPWSGGENPVPGQMVEVCLASGESYHQIALSDDYGRWWHVSGAQDHIIAFRPSPPVVHGVPKGDEGSSAGADTHRTDEEVSDLREMVAAAIEETDRRVAYSMELVKLIDGDHTYRLSIDGQTTFFTDSETDDWNAQERLYDAVREIKQRVRADAVLAVVQSFDPSTCGTNGEAGSEPKATQERVTELEAEVIRLRDVLRGIAVTDRYRRYPKQHDDGGIRGQSGLRAVRALTGQHGSYLNDDEVCRLDDEARALLSKRGGV